MNIYIYNKLPKEAHEIREVVFVKEQGFCKEFDEMDGFAKHMVLYDGNIAIATCRLFQREIPGDYCIGRIAVMKEYRGKKVGTYLLKAAEEEIKKSGGKRIFLHAQARAEKFYEKQGYNSYGEIDKEEDCLHIWMCKNMLS